jgi:type IV pilus assembly protein PilW
MVELMIAMLIGLIGMIIIFQVFEVSEGIKRTTTSGGDAQQNGAVALYVVEHDLRNAGMGFNDALYAGCNILAFDSTRAAQNFTMTLLPALICAPGSTAPGGNCPGTGTAGTSPDQLTIFYGSNPLVANATTITANVPAGNSTMQVSNSYGYRPGDLLVLLQPAAGTNCSLTEATGLPAANTVNYASGASYLLVSGTTKTARFNRPGGLSVAYGGVASANVTRVFNLGNLYEPPNAPALPVHNTYAINTNPAQPNFRSLTVASALVVDTATSAPQVSAVADNIVQLRAQYGVDDGVGDGSVAFGGGIFVAGDGLVDRFVSAAVFNALLPTPPWQSLIAVRLAIVARSALAEKPSGNDGAKCDATTDGTEATPGPDLRPKWSGGVFDMSTTGDPDPASPLYWKCYRYRVFETTVPLRNWIWRSS